MENLLSRVGVSHSQLLIILEVIVAMILGGIVGYDRQLADKPAGIRTEPVSFKTDGYTMINQSRCQNTDDYNR